MGAPSNEHEWQVELLETMARLADFTVAARLTETDIPDVVRRHRSQMSLLVADAKATESPRCRATRDRLDSYIQAVALWTSAGFSVRVALAHDRSPAGVGGDWLALLMDLARLRGLAPSNAGTHELGPGTALTWFDVATLARKPQGTARPGLRHRLRQTPTLNL